MKLESAYRAYCIAGGDGWHIPEVAAVKGFSFVHFVSKLWFHQPVDSHKAAEVVVVVGSHSCLGPVEAVDIPRSPVDWGAVSAGFRYSISEFWAYGCW
jgi:hypothetical protein